MPLTWKTTKRFELPRGRLYSQYLSTSVLAGSSSVGSAAAHHLQDNSSNLLISTVAHEAPFASVAPPDIGGESVLSDSPVPLLSATLRRLLAEQIPALQPLADSSSPFLGALSSSVSELLCTGQSITPSGKDAEHFQTDVSQEFKALLEDKFTDNPCLAFYTQNLFDYEQGVAPAIVKGRLKAHFQFWLDIGAPPWVLETVRLGYVISFESFPPSVCLPNNRSAFHHSDFVSSAISDLLNLGLIVEVFLPPTVINPLSVSVNSEGKARLILDLRHVNKHIPKAKFRMEDWKVVLQYVLRGRYILKFDLKSGYHHVDVCLSHQQFLGFQWLLGGDVNLYFCFTVLPFGFSSAPYLFINYFVPWYASGGPRVFISFCIWMTEPVARKTF